MSDEKAEAPKKRTRKKKEVTEDTLLSSNATGLVADGEQSSAEVTITGEAETLAEPLTTLDEELQMDEITVTGAGTGGLRQVPDALSGEYLTVVNETGFRKYTLPREEAVENARKGGFFLDEATPEEIEAYIRKQRHG